MIKITALLLCSLLSYSAEMSSVKPLTLTEALQILKLENLEIKSAITNVDASKADIEKINGLQWGKLDFIQDYANSDDAGNVFGFKLTSREATFGDFGFSEFDATNSNILNVVPDDLNYPESRNFFQSKLRYEIPLFTGHKISNYIQINKLISKIKSLEKDEVINTKTYEVRKSFYDMALLQNSIKNLQVILKNVQTLEATTQQMIEVGYAKKVDLLEVQAKKGNIERLILQMESNQKLLYHYISFLLNKKIEDIYAVSSNVPMPIVSTQEILNNNLSIQKASVALNIRKSFVDVSKSSYYPTVGAFAEVATADDTFLGDPDEHKSYTVGARLTWNIFNGGSDSADIQKSRINHLNTKIQSELAKEGILLQVNELKTKIQTYDFEIASLEKELTLANEIYKNYEGRYIEKIVSMSDVIIKQSAQIQKILELQKVKNERNERIFAFEKLANKENYE